MTVLVKLLLTGLCFPSVSFATVFYFVNKLMTWDDAENYCESEYGSIVKIRNEYTVSKLLNTPTGGYKGKAWMGLYWGISKWTWVNKTVATTFMWDDLEPSAVDANRFCVFVDQKTRRWKTSSCSEEKSFLCCNETLDYVIFQGRVTWEEARIICEERSLTLAVDTQRMSESGVYENLTEDVWIGLNRGFYWFWTDPYLNTGEFTPNWKDGQPDNLKGAEECAAVVVTDGTWTDEQCNATYPVVCKGELRSSQSVVSMKIQSSANLQDPTWRADLEKQLLLEFAKKGMTGLKLSWKKLVKDTP